MNWHSGPQNLSITPYNTFNSTETMNSQQLQAEIQKTQEQLKKLQEKLESSKVTIENAQPGDIFSDGCVVVERYKDSILIAAPKETEVRCEWTPDFPDVFTSLKDHGFIPCQWYIPPKEELQLAYKNCRQRFSTTRYWSSTEDTSSFAWGVDFSFGNCFYCNKAYVRCVRAFRRVVF